ncbi:Uncharacterized protein APZ42_002951 [Daphnia magna]|uniref:Uncharacterized protein n=1 Tax=Daphnia magna TaxID=35525 RepID=A0A164HXR0_9CRUS|nr:Uncharacterized protein APZ42_002951 [Daphnia magna]
MVIKCHGQPLTFFIKNQKNFDFKLSLDCHFSFLSFNDMTNAGYLYKACQMKTNHEKRKQN